MSIAFTKAYVANGKTFASLEEAQLEELTAIFEANQTDTAANVVMQNADKVIDILTTTDSSRPAARKINGGRKPRKPKTATATPDQSELGVA